MLVRVKEKGVKLSGKWCYKNDEREIDEVEYEKNKDFVDIIKEDIQEQIPQVPGEDDKDPEEIELQELRAKAKELGIRNYHIMKKENLEKAIENKTAPMFGTKPDTNSDNNTENPDETGNNEQNDGSSTNDSTNNNEENPEQDSEGNNENPQE